MALDTLKSFTRETLSRFVEDRCPRMAAGLAFFTVFSLPPLLLILLSVVGTISGDQEVEARLIEQIAALIGDTGAAAVETMVRNVSTDSRGPLAGTLGAIVLLFGATGAFAQLQLALNDAWEVAPDPSQGGVRNFLLKRLLSLGMVLAIGFLLLVSLVVSAALAAFGDWVSVWLPAWVSSGLLMTANAALSFALVALLFAAIFKVLPDARIAWRDVWVGAVLTALLFAAGKSVIGLYLGRSDLGSTYGAAGSLVVLLVWIYYASLVLLLGAEVTQVWARR
ncbi:MAG: YihY/virulence factor BrkB family protein, partial [Thermoanaerobaculia bacterium]|nr:YihY/virulence factor BrkB family protein [Thermoanaerobaculia bacterium]